MSRVYRTHFDNSIFPGVVSGSAIGYSLTNHTNSQQNLSDVISALRQVSALGEMSQEALSDLADVVKAQDYDQDEMIYRLGEPASYLHIVVYGRVIISCFSPNGRTMLTIKSPYSVFGDLFVSSDFQGQCQAQAHIDTRLFKISESDFVSLCRTHTELALALAKIATNRWQQTRQHLEDMVFLNARQRVLKLISRLCIEDSEEGPGRRNPILRFSQDELARLVGITRERINTILHELENEGIIQIRHRALRPDREKLDRALIKEGVASD